ncbi:MAG: ABC transporter permease [Acidithiobacillales bacterium]
MVFREILDTALNRFRTHPVQTWLTLAGLIAGTAAIILIVSLGLTGRGFVMEQIEGVGSHLVWAAYEGTVTSGVSRLRDDQITEGDEKALSGRTDLFRGVTPILQLQGTVTTLATSVPLGIVGTTSNYATIRRNVRIVAGRFLDEDDVLQRAKVCVVNRPLYEEMFGAEAVGEKTLRTLGMTFRIIGVFDKPVDTMGQGEVTPRTIFIPITVAWFFTPTHRVDILFAEVREFSQIPEGVAAMETTLRERHRQGAVFTVKSMTTVIRVAEAISSGLILLFVVAAAVSVFVGGVGIMNILLASVEQRTREIGLRKSLGARQRDILGQFLLEALLLGSIGSLIGVLLGLGLPLAARLVVTGVTVRVSALSGVLAFLFSCGVTILFGVYPAMRAASLSPVEALRHE